MIPELYKMETWYDGEYPYMWGDFCIDWSFSCDYVIYHVISDDRIWRDRWRNHMNTWIS